MSDKRWQIYLKAYLKVPERNLNTKKYLEKGESFSYLSGADEEEA